MKWRNSRVDILTSVPLAGCTSTSASSPAATSATSGGGVTINLTISDLFRPVALTVPRRTTSHPGQYRLGTAHGNG